MLAAAGKPRGYYLDLIAEYRSRAPSSSRGSRSLLRCTRRCARPASTSRSAGSMHTWRASSGRCRR